MAAADNRYEFNAPKHYFDFMKDDVEVDESFFGKLMFLNLSTVPVFVLI